MRRANASLNENRQYIQHREVAHPRPSSLPFPFLHVTPRVMQTLDHSKSHAKQILRQRATQAAPDRLPGGSRVSAGSSYVRGTTPKKE